MKVSQFHVKNQFLIEGIPGPINWMSGLITGSGDIFQSYKSIIAFREYTGQIYLDAVYWNYSRTTSKYLGKFLNMTSKKIQKKVKSGEYKLVNLN